MKKGLTALWNGLLKAEHGIVIVCCIAVVGLVFVTVIMRYFFQASFQGMEELVMLFAFGIYFIGGALGSCEETQITADVVSIFIQKPRNIYRLRAFQRGVETLLLGTCGVFATSQMLVVLDSGARSTGLKFPLWIMYTIILVGLFLMAMYSLIHCID